jgi:hypothetical protein
MGFPRKLLVTSQYEFFLIITGALKGTGNILFEKVKSDLPKRKKKTETCKI